MAKVTLNLPKKYLERFDHLWSESGLTDNCKYILYLKENWYAWADGENSFPIRTKKEALNIIKEAYYKIK